MCEQLSGLRQAMQVYAGDFDAALIHPASLNRVVEDATAICHMAATIKGLAAERLAQTERWKNDGARSPAHALAKQSGSSVSEAARELERAKRLKKHPRTEQAAKTGKVSPAQAAAITDAAEADPAAEEELLRKAPDLSLRELEEEAARKKAAATETEERHRRVYRRRSLRSWDDRDGGAHIHAYGTPDAIARIMAVVETLKDRLFREAYKQGKREPTEAYAFDALHRAVCGDGEVEKSRNSAAKVLVRVDLESLLRGHPVDGEVCEIAGYGPVPVSVIEELLARGDTFLAAVITRGERISGVAHLGRRPTARQRSALEWLYPTCAAEGCSARVVQWDHREDWAKTHVTIFEALDGLCRHDHAKKTHAGWSLVDGVGKRAFVPPDDPRHPKNANAPPERAA